MQVLPQCGHAVHEDAPEKVRPAYVNVLCAECPMTTVFGLIAETAIIMSHCDEHS